METFDEWLDTPLGHYVVACEQAIYDRVLPNLFGFYALQMGAATVPRRAELVALRTKGVQHGCRALDVG